MEADELTHSTRYVESELCRRLKAIEEQTNSDVITCIHPIQQPMDDFIRDYIEDLKKDRRDSLLVILETNGGSIETAERIADVFRNHYPKEVNFLVPNFAMSAGTVLLMSGDKIFMDYYSILGPIDPQVRNRDGQFVPALCYLEKYEQLTKKSAKGNLTAAELAFLIQKFDPAQIHRFEQARDHSVDLLKKWLVQYKFKNWAVTHTKKLTVTPQMREKRAADIATKLNDTKRWRSHARGLSMDVITADLNLVIEDFGQDAELNKRIRSYYRLLKDHLNGRSHTVALQTREGFMAI
ncbi:ATP-dependent Clp protease proteolytic subunit [Mesorhizobium sp. M0984]|uniref:SDH family Clp fold serine proteinase n=1 Tax=Mesorhizobium sp. M0984 TaxID=2957041 RepID=UPI0033391F30